MRLDGMVADLASRLPSMGAREPVVALCYHAVVRDPAPNRWSVTRADFERHLELLARSGALVQTAGELVGARGPVVAITFDDNLATHVDEALPALLAAGMCATFFVNPGELDPHAELDRADVERLAAEGMAVGAHHDRHLIAARQPLHEFARGVDRCSDFLDSLGMPLTWAYPGGYPGSFGSSHERVLIDRGFEIRFTTVEAPVRSDRPERPQGRYVIRSDTTDRYLGAALRGGLGLVRLAKRARAMVGATEL